jgi:hypothetical protein
MFTFLNIAKVLSWIAMVYMILTPSDYFMGAVLFYYIALAVIITMTFLLTLGSSHAVDSIVAPPKVKSDAVVLLNKLHCESWLAALVPSIISGVLLVGVGLPMLAYSQAYVILILASCKNIARKHN